MNTTLSQLTLNAMVLLCCIQLASRPVVAEEPAAQPTAPFKIEPALDVPIIVISGALALLPSAFDKQITNTQITAPLNKNEVNRFDRTTINQYNPSLSHFSDALVIALPAAALLISLPQVKAPGGKSAFAQDALLLLETLAVTTAAMQLVKTAFDRPRPYMYQGTPAHNHQTHTGDDTSSFYSGHTALAFAAALSTTWLFHKRHPQARRATAMVALTTILAATGVGLLRVYSGKHFFTDVIAGALVGGATGVLVPALHQTSSLPNVAVGPGAVQFQLAF